MANKSISKIKETAEALYNMRQLISDLEDKNKVTLDALKVERDAMQTILLADMKSNGLLSLKVKSGDSVIVGSRKGIEVIDPIAGMRWAMENHAVSINKLMVAQKLKDAETLPSGFQCVETEFISVRKKAGKTKVESENEKDN